MTGELPLDYYTALPMVNEDGRSICFFGQEIKANRTIVMAAVENNGKALQHASEELRADPEIVLAAVKNHGGALEYASEGLQADEETVKAAIGTNCSSFKLASEELKSDPDFCLEAVRTNPCTFQYLPDSFMNDLEFLLKVFGTEGRAIEYVPEQFHKSIKNDPLLVAAALQSKKFKQSRTAFPVPWCGEHLKRKLICLQYWRRHANDSLLSSLDSDTNLEKLVREIGQKCAIVNRALDLLPSDLKTIVVDAAFPIVSKEELLLEECIPVIRAYGDVFGNGSWSAIFRNEDLSLYHERN